MENVSSSSHGPSDTQSDRSPVNIVSHDILVKIFSYLDVEDSILHPSPRLSCALNRPAYPAKSRKKVKSSPSVMMSYSFTAHLFRASLVCKSFFLPAIGLLWQSMDSFVPILNLLPTTKNIDGVFMFTEDIQAEDVERFKMYGSRIRKFTLTDVDQFQIAPFTLLRIAAILPNIPHAICSSARALSSSSAFLLLTNGLRRFELTNVTDTTVHVIKPFLCTLQARASGLEHLILRDSLNPETLSVISNYQSLLSLELVGNIDIVLFSRIVALPELRKLILNVADSMPVETPRTANLIGLKKLETLHITGFGPTIESFILRLEGSSLINVGVTELLPDPQDPHDPVWEPVTPDPFLSRSSPAPSTQLLVLRSRSADDDSIEEMQDTFLCRSLSALNTKWPALRSLSANITNRPSREVPEVMLNAIKGFEKLENLHLELPLRPAELLDLATKLSNLITLRVVIMKTDLLDLGYLSSIVNTFPNLSSLHIKFGLCGISVDSLTSFALNPHLKTLIINAAHDPQTMGFRTALLVGEYLVKIFPGLQRVEIECPGTLFWEQVREIVIMIQRVRRVEREMKNTAE